VTTPPIPVGGGVFAGAAAPPPPPPPPIGSGYAVQPLSAASAASGGTCERTVQPLSATSSAAAHATTPGQPPPGGDHVTVSVISDVQVANSGQTWVSQGTAVRDYVIAQGYDKLINIGDETNSDGAPPRGGGWPLYIPIWDSRKADFYPCHGSTTHVTLAHWQAYYGRSASQYYWEIFGWRIINLDSNNGATSMTTYLNANAVAGQPTIVCWHEPPYSGGDRHPGGNASLRPVFAACVARGVELVLCGHVHIYQRFPRMNGSGAADAANGTRLIVTADAGQANEVWTSSSTVPMEAHNTAAAAGATVIKLYKDRYTWAYKDVMLGSGGPGTYTDTGSQMIRHPIP
jgi:Calcineurin-like phosphoesterase